MKYYFQRIKYKKVIYKMDAAFVATNTFEKKKEKKVFVVRL